jgi:DHA2 family multidrug resistance protein
MARGFSASESLKKAYQVLEFNVNKQSAVLSYNDIFFYLGMLFLLCIPFVLIIKKGKKVNLSEAAH